VALPEVLNADQFLDRPRKHTTQSGWLFRSLVEELTGEVESAPETITEVKTFIAIACREVAGRSTRSAPGNWGDVRLTSKEMSARMLGATARMAQEVEAQPLEKTVMPRESVSEQRGKHYD
jgi:hypothetical protein